MAVEDYNIEPGVVIPSGSFLMKEGCAMQPYCRAIMFKETRDVVGLYKGGRKEIGY